MTSNDHTDDLIGCSTWRRHQFSTFKAIQPWVNKDLEIFSFDRHVKSTLFFAMVNCVLLHIAQPGGGFFVLHSKITDEIDVN